MGAGSGSRIDRGSDHELPRRTFTAGDQEWFARFSGDHNPMHMDPIVARRLMFGRPVVHGVHVAMWALDAYLGENPRPVSKIEVSFSRPVYLDEPVDLLIEPGDDEDKLRVELAGRTLASLRVHVGGPAGSPVVPSAASDIDIDLPTRPRELHLAELECQRGRMPIPTGCARREDRYETLARVMSERFVAELASLSRLVGMECPGLHSIFGGFSVNIDGDRGEEGLTWEVSRVAPAFSALRIRVAGQALRGTVSAFVRPEPQRQVASIEISDHVGPAEFESVRALIVGGSRGLGELTAKLLAAGGAEVTLTWHRGRQDAESVAAEIRSAAGAASTIEVDVVDPLRGLRTMPDHGELPTHLFYFASPRITTRRLRMFDPAVFRGFADAYVDGFARTVEACRAIGVDRLVAFYPSTVAIEWSDPDLVEYAAAKAAGETMAASLAGSQEWLDVLIERLPAVATDQTATLTTSGRSMDPLPLMVAVLRKATDGTLKAER